MFYKSLKRKCLPNELFVGERQLRNMDTSRSLLLKWIIGSFDEKGMFKVSSDKENYKANLTTLIKVNFSSQL